MKNKRIILIIVVSVIAFTLLCITSIKLEGKHTQENGVVYYFKDGFVAVDNHYTPNEYYVFEYKPEIVKNVIIHKDGLEVFFKNNSMEWLNEDGGETDFNINTDKIKTDRPAPGRVSYCLANNSKFEHIQHKSSTDEINSFLIDQNWNKSVKGLTKKINR